MDGSSGYSPEKETVLKGHFIFQPSFFRGYVSFQGGYIYMNQRSTHTHIHMYIYIWLYTLQETNISPKNAILKMIFLFPRWDMLIPWRVYIYIYMVISPISILSTDGSIDCWGRMAMSCHAASWNARSKSCGEIRCVAVPVVGMEEVLMFVGVLQENRGDKIMWKALVSMRYDMVWVMYEWYHVYESLWFWIFWVIKPVGNMKR